MNVLVLTKWHGLIYGSVDILNLLDRGQRSFFPKLNKLEDLKVQKATLEAVHKL